jgi:hypothetical protein
LFFTPICLRPWAGVVTEVVPRWGSLRRCTSRSPKPTLHRWRQREYLSERSAVVGVARPDLWVARVWGSWTRRQSSRDEDDRTR